MARKVAENPLPQSELTHAPEDVNTLREEEICPVCGSEISTRKCEVCGYEIPPDGLDNPDLDKAKGQEVPDPLDPETNLGQAGPLETELPESNATNLPLTASVKGDMASWKVKLPSRVAERINVTETPILPGPGPSTDEPHEEVVSDEPRPTTSRTAEEFIKAVEHYKAKKAAEKKAAEPVPAAAPDKRIDPAGSGGVQDASNEQASAADGQVDVEGKGGTGVTDVSADSEGEEVARGNEHSKNLEAIHTDTWSTQDGQRSPVSDKPFPASGEGVRSSVQHQGGDAAAFPKDDGNLSEGGGAVQGVAPVDPVGNADDRVDVLKPATSPENNSGRTKTWTGTDGNKVQRQQDPVTNETLEGADRVSHSSIISAFKLADLEVELGLLPAERKYARVAELEQEAPEKIAAELKYAQRVKSSDLAKNRQSKRAHRLPSLSRTPNLSPKTAKQDDLKEDSYLFT